MNATPPSSEFRSGYVSLVGRPNVGKSTLLNRILGQKLAIVTSKPQTTRQRIMAIWGDDSHQIIFLDTPGLMTPRHLLHSAMVEVSRNAIKDADVVLALHDVTSRPESFDDVLKEAKLGSGRLLIALNKVDKVAKESLLPLIDRIQGIEPEAEIVPISALAGDNVDHLLDMIREAMPPGPLYYPSDVLTEQPERFFVAEIIRETILQRYRNEVPHAVQVEIERFEEREGRKDEIDAVIHVERTSQKAILIGAKGAAIKELGIRSRAEIETFLDRPIVLKMFVRVTDDWRRDEQALRRLGFTS